jgi:hypothetical protein
LTILQGDGKGGFQPAPASPIAVGANPSAIAVGAFNINKDRHLGLAVTNAQDNTITILLGDGKGNFSPAPGSSLKLASGQENPVAIITTDFNLDGKPDLAVVNETTGNVTILLGNGDGTFAEAPGSPIAVGKSPVAITSTHFDADAHPDLAVVNQADNTVSLWRGSRGDGSFFPTQNPRIATGITPAAIVSADFNADGLADLVVANSGASNISLYFGLGGGAFSDPIPLRTGSTPRALVAASFSGTGRADLAIADERVNQVTVILNLLSSIPPANGGIGQQPYPGAEYLDLGLKVKATPRLHGDSEVSLQMQFEIRSLAGSALNGIPVISNRTIEQSVRLREDETTIIAGMLQRDEMRSISGWPGLATIPIGGVFAGKRRSNPRDSELIILITPRQLRLTPTAGRPLYAGRGDEAVPHGEGPMVPPPATAPTMPGPGPTPGPGTAPGPGITPLPGQRFPRPPGTPPGTPESPQIPPLPPPPQ